MRERRSLLLLGIVGMLSFDLAAADKALTLAPVKNDQALVYVIRTMGGMIWTGVFWDGGVLAHLKGHNYSYAYVPPGRHLVWPEALWQQGTREVDLVAGQVYYVWDVDPAGGGDLAFLDEDDAHALMKDLSYRPLEPKDAAEKGKKALENYPKVKAFLTSDPRRAPLEDIPAAAHASTLGDSTPNIRVPAQSPVTLELMETVTSAWSKPGQDVWFRVAADAMVDGRVWLRAGTPVRGRAVFIDSSGTRGRSGSIQIQIPAVPLDGGQSIPTVGQILTGSKSKSTLAGALVGGVIFGGLLVKGRETYHLAGATFSIATRDDASAPVAAERPAPGAGAAVTITAKSAGALRLDPSSGKPPDSVEIAIDAAGPVNDLELRSVGDWQIPRPPKAATLKPQGSGSAAQFPGWDLLRHIRAAPAPTELRFGGTLADGRPFEAVARETTLQLKQ